MKEYSLSCFWHAGAELVKLSGAGPVPVFKVKKGRNTLSSIKQAAAACQAAGLILLMSMGQTALLTPSALAKGQLSNVSPPFNVVDEKQGPKAFQVVKMVVKARPGEVFKILTDYENAPAVFPHLLKCHVLEDRGLTKIVDHKVQPSGLLGSFEYVLEVKETPGKLLEWHRISGDFKEVDGYWKLQALENGRETLVTYSTHINGGFFIPQAMIKRQCHLDMPGVMLALKTQSENGTPQIAGRIVPSRRY